jgi:phosphoglycolate phosphatase-like HAD superfamily hydrolase
MLIQKTRYVFDFDGVICNSIEECYFTAFVLYFKKNKYLLFKKFYKKYFSILKKLRVFAKSGLDYYVIMYILDKNLEVKNIDNFIKIKNKIRIDKKKFNKLFYYYRNKNRKENYYLWILLNPLYKGLKSFIKKLIDQKLFYILTYKDRQSVIDILKENKILIPKKNVISVSYDNSKKTFFTKKNNYIFIEDNIYNLLDVNLKNAKKFLATWGYNSKQEISLARRNNIRAISLLDLRKLTESF